MLSITEQIRQEAIDEMTPVILARGEARGRAEGEARGIARALVRLLGRRFGAAAVSEYEARIMQADVEQLGIWTDRVLDAPSIEAVFDNNPLSRRDRLNGDP